MMARIRANRSGFSKAWERAVSFQSRMTAPRSEAVAGAAIASVSMAAQPVMMRCIPVISL